MTYQLQADGLAEAVAEALPAKSHSALLQAVRSCCPAWTNLRVVAEREGGWWGKRKVIAPSGEVVADDHEAWLAAELDRDDGNLSATQARLQPMGYRLSECSVSTLYLAHDRSADPSDFVQLEVYLEHETVDRRMFSAYGMGYLSLRTVRDLVDAAEQGEGLPENERVAVGAIRYRLHRAVDVQQFVREASGVEGARQAIARQRYIMVTDVDESSRVHEPKPVRIGDLDPEGLLYPWPGQRLMDDWAASSAGMSGARLCHHWALQLSDYTDPKGARWMSLVPVWAHRAKIAALEKRPASDSNLLEKLRSIDRRTGAPFNWYFYMLHGNLVEPWAGKAIATAARDGIVDLPEHDLAVLNRWVERSYGF